MRIFLFFILFIGTIATSVADEICPIGYGYQPPATFFGNNLNNASTTTGGISNTGEHLSDPHYRTNNFTEIPVEIGKSYTFAASEPNAGKYLATYDSNHNFIERIIVSDDNYICPNGVAYVIPILFVDNESKWKQSELDTQILFLNTPLYRVGNYADEIDWQRQQIIHNIGVKVFDGTEDITLAKRDNNRGFFFFIGTRVPGLQTQTLNTHFNITFCYQTYNYGMYDNGLFQEGYTIQDVRDWLATQYAAGTPVIVYYPLATPVVEEISDSKYGEYQMPVINGYCSLCPPNTYKDFVGNSECTPCPNRTISLSGSASVNDCGHILHVGNFITFMPVGKRTEHGLCTMLNGKKYCADMYERQ